MENLRAELSFLESKTNKSDRTEYFIGLKKKVNGKFTWISDNSTLQETEEGKYPWHEGQPSNEDESECVKIWRNPGGNYFFDDVKCYFNTLGYICERSVKCKNTNGKSSKKQ